MCPVRTTWSPLERDRLCGKCTLCANSMQPLATGKRNDVIAMDRGFNRFGARLFRTEKSCVVGRVYA